MKTPQDTPIDDLVEFYEQWPELRQHVKDLLQTERLDEQQKTVIRSMMHVVDCVGPADLKHG